MRHILVVMLQWIKQSWKEIVSYALLSICIWYYAYYQVNMYGEEVTYGYQFVSLLFIAASFLFYKDNYGEVVKEIFKCIIIVAITRIGDIILLRQGDISSIIVNIAVILVYYLYALALVWIFRYTKKRYVESYATRVLILQLVLFGLLYFGGGTRTAIYWISSEEWYQTSQWAKGLELLWAFVCTYFCIEFLTSRWRQKTIQIREQEYIDEEKKKEEELEREKEYVRMKKEMEVCIEEKQQLLKENAELKQKIHLRNEKDKRKNKRESRKKL